VVEGSLMLASHALALAGVPLYRVLRQVREVRDNRYGLLRGYFHGSTEDANERGSDVLLRSFPLPITSGCVNQPIEALDLGAIGVEIGSVRRGRERIAVSPQLILEAEDVLMLRGTSEGLALAEELLSSASRLK